MCSAFCMGPTGNGLGPGDFDQVFLELVNHVSNNWDVLAWRTYIEILCFSVCTIIGIFLSCLDFPFLTLDLLT